MKKTKIIAINLVALLILSTNVFAVEHSIPNESPDDPFIKLMLEQVSFMEGRITSLAEAIPAERYSWRPAEGVRSVGEVVVHTLGASFFIPSMMGGTLPEGVNREMEKTITDKKEILEKLAASFKNAKEFLNNYDVANYEKMVETPFGTFSQRTMILIINNHLHEHLGQLIAYARSNGVTPPWSEKEN